MTFQIELASLQNTACGASCRSACGQQPALFVSSAVCSAVSSLAIDPGSSKLLRMGTKDRHCTGSQVLMPRYVCGCGGGGGEWRRPVPVLRCRRLSSVHKQTAGGSAASSDSSQFASAAHSAVPTKQKSWKSSLDETTMTAARAATRHAIGASLLREHRPPLSTWHAAPAHQLVPQPAFHRRHMCECSVPSNRTKRPLRPDRRPAAIGTNPQTPPSSLFHSAPQDASLQAGPSTAAPSVCATGKHMCGV